MKLLVLIASIVLFLSSGIQANAHVIQDQSPLPVEPTMSDFFLECMKRGATPGHADDPILRSEYYAGPKYLFQIWTPPTTDYSAGIKVTRFVPSPRDPNLRVQVDKTLGPGKSISIVTNQFWITSAAHRGNDTPQEFCIRQQPIQFTNEKPEYLLELMAEEDLSEIE